MKRLLLSLLIGIITGLFFMLTGYAVVLAIDCLGPWAALGIVGTFYGIFLTITKLPENL